MSTSLAMGRAAPLALGLVAAIAACTTSAPSTVCLTRADCAATEECVGGRCVQSEADVGAGRDAATPDAAAIDATTDALTQREDAFVSTDASIDAASTDGAVPIDAFVRDAGVACPPIASRPVVEVTSDITSDTTWDCAHLWSLHTEISVVNASTSPSARTTLTIEPGTVVVSGLSATGHAGALLVGRTGRLVAEGTVALPITFTSDRPVGMRHAGDWAGISLAGRATGNAGPSSISALPSATYPAGRFGPLTGMMADETWECGRLSYVRIEFAGAAVASGDSLAALSLGACGSGTSIHHLETHRTLDDGLTIYGGNVDLSHVLVSASEEDSLDWNNGWRGRVQFLLLWQWPTSAGADTSPNHAIEADTSLDAMGVPRVPGSHPTIYNATFVCSADVTDPCVFLRSGSEALFGDTLLHQADASDDVLDLCDDTTAATATSHSLDFVSSVVTDRFGMSVVSGCTSTFDDRAWACSRATCDPALTLAFSYTSPVFDPGPALRGRCGATPTDPPDGRPAFFDRTATFCGAVGTTDWTAGWTELPVN